MSHVAIGVRDMDRSMRFYTDVVGMEVRFDDTEEFGGRLETKRRGVYLQMAEDPDATFVVLDQQLAREPFGEPAQMLQVGLHHFGFWVDDVDEVLARAEQAGAPVYAGPFDADSKDYGEPPGKTIRTLLLQDPEGNVVQFDQRVD